MRIENIGQPYAGQQFRFTVTNTLENTRIQVYIDKMAVLETECPDPPCHEMIAIPYGTRGSILSIIGTDRRGRIVKVQFEIAESERGQSSPMTAGG